MGNTNANVIRLFSNVGEPVSVFYTRLEVGQFGYHVDTNVIVVRTGESTYKEVGKELYSTFLSLTDTFPSYTGNGGKALVVNGTEDGVDVADFPDASKFIPLPGVSENKVYISKVNENTISVIAGNGTIRKSDLTEVERTWNTIASFDVSSVLDGQLRWCVFQNDGTETGLEFTLLSSAPVLLDNAEQYLWVGRIWRENGVLKVGDRHIMLSVDPQVSRTNVWQFPAGNVSVTVHHATDVGLLSLSAGELTRWPVVESGTFHHVWKYNGLATVSSMWDHVQGSVGFTTISDNAAGNETDIRTIADYYDQNGNLVAVPTNDWVAHLIGVYAGSEERVLFRGQRTYTTLADAKLGITIDPLEEADWAKDLRQISKIGWILVREGTRDFSNTARCVFVPYSLLGSGGGSGTTPNLEQVLDVSGPVDISDRLDNDRVMTFSKNGEFLWSLFGNGKQLIQECDIAFFRSAVTEIYTRLVSLSRSQFGGAVDTGATISVVDTLGVEGELFVVPDITYGGEGLFTDQGDVDLDYGDTAYRYDTGGGTIYYAYKGSVSGGAFTYWFVGTQIRTGADSFNNLCDFQSTDPVPQSSVSPSSDAVGYIGIQVGAYTGAFENQVAGVKESINAETIVADDSGDAIEPAVCTIKGRTIVLDRTISSVTIDAGVAGGAPFVQLTQGGSSAYVSFTGGQISISAGGQSISIDSSGLSVSNGASGTFTSSDGKTVTVVNGVITSIV